MGKTISEKLQRDYPLFSSPTEAAVHHIEMAMAHIYKHIPDSTDILASLTTSKMDLQFKQAPEPVSIGVAKPAVVEVTEKPVPDPEGFDQGLITGTVLDEEFTPAGEFDFMEKEEEEKVKSVAELLGDVLISELGTTVVGTVFKLNAKGIHTVKELTSLSLENLFAIRGLGPLSIIDIQARLAAHGLQLNQERLSDETLSALAAKPKPAPKRTRLHVTLNGQE